MTYDRPIPEFSDLDFRTVKIQECGEPVIRLVPGERLHVYPAYHARGFATASPSIYLRTGVTEALRIASLRLPKGMAIVVYDGLRSLQTQKEIADRFAVTLANAPMTDDERADAISRFVAPLPATEDEYRSAPPPHSTGAAVDVSLVGDDGMPIDLGADFDQFDEIAATTYYEDICRKRTGSADDRARRNRRRMLYWAMIDAGFAPYPDEYWHFEFGTSRAMAFHQQSTAKYGAVAPWFGKQAEVA